MAESIKKGVPAQRRRSWLPMAAKYGKSGPTTRSMNSIQRAALSEIIVVQQAQKNTLKCRTLIVEIAGVNNKVGAAGNEITDDSLAAVLDTAITKEANLEVLLHGGRPHGGAAHHMVVRAGAVVSERLGSAREHRHQQGAHDRRAHVAGGQKTTDNAKDGRLTFLRSSNHDSANQKALEHSSRFWGEIGGGIGGLDQNRSFATAA